MENPSSQYAQVLHEFDTYQYIHERKLCSLEIDPQNEA
jgi:hypothetical protein